MIFHPFEKNFTLVKPQFIWTLDKDFQMGQLEILSADVACETVGLESFCHLFGVYFQLYFKGLII